MEIYLLKATACLGLFFAFYKLVLENISIHNFKRFYLLGSLAAAFIIPIITFTTYVEVSPSIPVYTENIPIQFITETEATTNYWQLVLWSVYGLGVLFFSVKFFRNLFRLIHKIRKNSKYRNSSFIHVLLNETVIPHTFFNYILLNKQQFESHKIPAEVLLHEETHARQKHSLDIVIVELLQIVFWFNPLIYFIKKSIKLNHEFLADGAVLKAGAETSAYQKLLLAFSSPDSYRDAYTPSLAHSINYSSIKKRFTVMKTHTSKRAIWLRSLLLLPLVSFLIYGFSTNEIIEKETTDVNNQQQLIQQKASEAELAEYNKLAKSYNAVAIEKRIIKKKDLERLEIIYKKMSDAQKAKAQPFTECDCPSPVDSKTEENKKFREATYYFKGKKISYNKANELMNNNTNLGIYVGKPGNQIDTIHLYEEPFDIKKISIPIHPKVIITEKTASGVKPPKTPKAPKVKKGEKSDIPPPPPAPKAPSAENGNLYTPAQAPPPPNSNTIEYVKELGKRGATFYIGPHKYNTEEALELVKKSKDATIDVSNYPKVILGGC
ncbi:M56 family metallopeptidase [Aequorivita sp. Q41]|uniref:M56 family metallopeptidase n=1 Tax=Aequorivita sp. Q41 TaxID=3153300 RepID=UPI003242FBCB